MRASESLVLQARVVQLYFDLQHYLFGGTLIISVIIPVYNEVDTINQILDAVHASSIWREHEKEIIVIDDFSTDGTRELLLGDLNKKYSRLILHEKNQGKGAALKSGFEVFQGDVLIIQDADLEYDPQEYQILLEPIEKNRADVVYGSRFVGGRSHRVVYFWHMVGNKILTLFSNFLTNINLTDMESCYKVFRRDVAKLIHIQ